MIPSFCHLSAGNEWIRGFKASGGLARPSSSRFYPQWSQTTFWGNRSSLGSIQTRFGRFSHWSNQEIFCSTGASNFPTSMKFGVNFDSGQKISDSLKTYLEVTIPSNRLLSSRHTYPRDSLGKIGYKPDTFGKQPSQWSRHHKRSEVAICGQNSSAHPNGRKRFTNPLGACLSGYESFSRRCPRIFRDFWSNAILQPVFHCKPAPKKTISLETELRSELERCNRVCAKLLWSFTSLKSRGWSAMADVELLFGVTFTKGNALILIVKRGVGPISGSIIADRLCVFLSAHRVHSNWFPSA